MTKSNVFSRYQVLALTLTSVALPLTLAGCNNDNNGNASTGPGPTLPANQEIALGSVNLNCGASNGTSNGQQQQNQSPVQFKPIPQQPGTCTQKVKFQTTQSYDFNLDLDCTSHMLTVTSKDGTSAKPVKIPVQGDGTISGNGQFVQQVLGDGSSPGTGGQVCWVTFDTKFDGKASCPAPTATSTTDQQKSVQVATQVDFKKPDPSQLQQAGVAELGPIIDPGPGPVQNPSPSPSVTPSPSPSPSPSTSPLPGQVGQVVCVIQDPCPVAAQTDVSCGQQQQTAPPTPAPSASPLAITPTSPIQPNPSTTPVVIGSGS